MKANPTTNVSSSLLAKYGKEEMDNNLLHGGSDHQMVSLLLTGGRIIDDRDPMILPPTKDAFPGNTVTFLHGSLHEHMNKRAL
jgi:hypothetical protein